MTTTSTHYAHGKLLFTGEYLVMHGALSLALPCRFGQKMKISRMPAEEPSLLWKSVDHKSNCWYENEFSLPSFDSDMPESAVTTRLKSLLRAVQSFNPEFLSGPFRWEVENYLEFPLDWGLGSSSTLVSNLAAWADIDPFRLQFEIFGGSGYDIACARSKGPIYYKKIRNEGRWDHIPFDPTFRDQLYFLHLGRKQDSREAIRSFEAIDIQLEPFVKTITHLTIAITNSPKLEDFEQLLQKHESVLSTVLKEPPVKQKLFPDYWGAVKSLGAWGGDFVMVSSNRNFAQTRRYFRDKGFKTLLRYDEIVLANEHPL